MEEQKTKKGKKIIDLINLDPISIIPCLEKPFQTFHSIPKWNSLTLRISRWCKLLRFKDIILRLRKLKNVWKEWNGMRGMGDENKGL